MINIGTLIDYAIKQYTKSGRTDLVMPLLQLKQVYENLEIVEPEYPFVKSELRPSEQKIFEILKENLGKTVSYQNTASRWEAEFSQFSLRSTISRLRKKLVGYKILTIHREGYRLVPYKE